MPDTLDAILFDLRAVLGENDCIELHKHLRSVTDLATVEALLRYSFKSPNGGASIRERVFKVTTRGVHS
jgi:hypothetical protein